MVFVWSQLTRGDPTYTLVQVSANDVIMIFAFAPIVALLLGVTDITVPWETLLLSVGLYILIPLAAGALTRRALMARLFTGRVGRKAGAEDAVARFRSEEHTSELQSLMRISYAVFCLKKKKHKCENDKSDK